MVASAEFLPPAAKERSPPHIVTPNESPGDRFPSTPKPSSHSPAEELRRVMELEDMDRQRGFQAGRYYFLIDHKWYTEWTQWVGHYSARSPKTSYSPLGGEGGMQRQRSWSKERPGPIDNSALLDDDGSGVLKRGLIELSGYKILCEEIWTALQEWYQGGPVIKRKAINSGGRVVVEIYGITLRIHVSNDLLKAPVSILESKVTSIEDFKRRLCQQLTFDYDKVRIWDYYNKRKYGRLDYEGKLDQSLDSCRIGDANDILVEVQLPDGTWPKEEQPKLGGSTFYDAPGDVATSGTSLQLGAVGLLNLGNTCFMNSSIQCLSSIPDLREYFVTDNYKASVNTTAFKTKGKLAGAFSELLRLMWKPGTSHVAPRNFKWQISQFAEQFSGYRQHDSMEFIEYVLDGLKEDLNSVQGTKPFVELRDADGRPDEVVAEEARQNYLLRNNSFIDDLFLGLFKSTVTCPEASCGRVSVKFDPFLSLKVPLSSAAEERKTTFSVVVVPRLSGGLEIKSVDVKVDKFGNSGDIINAAAKQMNLDPKCCILTEFYDKSIRKIFYSTDLIEGIRPGDILVLYEQEYMDSEPLSPSARKGECTVVIQQRRLKVSTYLSRSKDFVGIPLLTTLKTKTTGSDLIEAVRSVCRDRIGLVEHGWKLFMKSEYTYDDAGTEVLPVAEVLTLVGEPHVKLFVEWPEDFELPDAVVKAEESIKAKSSLSSKGGSVELESCIKMFTETDKLSAVDAWYCSSCKEHREAFKKMEFWSLPPVLVLQLKRFTYTSYSRSRLDTAIKFPLEGLNMAPYVLTQGRGEFLYDLAAISIHRGGLGFGHYVAYARSDRDAHWYYFDDSNVTRVEAAAVTADAVGAYVLFYLRRDRRPVAWGAPL